MEEQTLERLLDLAQNRFFGKYRGRVTDNQDSAQQGRVKVLVPAVLGEREVWAMPCLPYTGQDMGSYFMPEPDSGVWVEFEGGDPSFPIWTGGFWGDFQLPDTSQGLGGNPDVKVLKTRSGLQISLNDTEETLSLSDANGANLLRISVNSGEIVLKSALKVKLETPQVELTNSASAPVVLGDELLSYLQNLALTLQLHAHPFHGAPPSVSIPFPTPSMLSLNVTTS